MYYSKLEALQTIAKADTRGAWLFLMSLELATAVRACLEDDTAELYDPPGTSGLNHARITEKGRAVLAQQARTLPSPP
jgi:hypothetical protein